MVSVLNCMVYYGAFFISLISLFSVFAQTQPCASCTILSGLAPKAILRLRKLPVSPECAPSHKLPAFHESASPRKLPAFPECAPPSSQQSKVPAQAAGDLTVNVKVVG